jgi:hypothetical protein
MSDLITEQSGLEAQGQGTCCELHCLPVRIVAWLPFLPETVHCAGCTIPIQEMMEEGWICLQD